MKTIEGFKSENKVAIGVGLRHPHYSDVLAPSISRDDNEVNSSVIDFVEVHSENFFLKAVQAEL